MIETSLVLPLEILRLFLEIFGNLWECSETIVWPLNKFWGIFGNCFGKLSKKYGYVKKQNNTCLLVEVEFLFLCTTWYLMSERCEQVRYQVEHLKRNSIAM